MWAQGVGVEYRTRGGRMKWKKSKTKQRQNKKCDEWSLLVQACSGVANMHNAQPCTPRQSVPYIRTSIYTPPAMHIPGQLITSIILLNGAQLHHELFSMIFFKFVSKTKPTLYPHSIPIYAICCMKCNQTTVRG